MALRIDLLPSALRSLRAQTGRTQTDIASTAGIGQAELSRYELGKQQLTMPRLGAVLDALGFDLADLQVEIDNHPDGDGPLRQAVDEHALAEREAAVAEAAQINARPELRAEFQALWDAIAEIRGQRPDDDA